MDIVIIGTGNIATVLGRMLRLAGHTILQVYGRNSAAASELAYELNAASTNYWAVVEKTADVYLIAVSDISIAEVVQQLQLSPQVVVHTAASVSKEVLRPASQHYGIFYPLQSINKNAAHLPQVPLLIDASDENTLALLQNLGDTISRQVTTATDEERAKMHVAAVFCSNFVNHLYAVAEAYCIKEGLSFQLLQPLILETAQRAGTVSPAAVQTGPAHRGDEPTLEAHYHLLAQHPQLLQLYKTLSESIRQHKGRFS